MTANYIPCFVFENIVLKISDSQVFQKIFHMKVTMWLYGMLAMVFT